MSENSEIVEKEKTSDNFLIEDFFFANNPNVNVDLVNNDDKVRKNKNGDLVNKLKDHFASNPSMIRWFDDKYGLPVWSHVVVDESVDGLLTVPFAKLDGSNITSILLCHYKVDGNWGFQLIDKNKLNRYKPKNKIPVNKQGKRKELSKKLVLAMFLKFDGELFDYVDCNMVDELKRLSNIKSINTKDYFCSYVVYEETSCYCSEGGGTVYCYDCTATLITEYVCTQTTSGFSYGGGGGGGSGGSTDGSTTINNDATATEGEWESIGVRNLCLPNLLTEIGEAGLYVNYTNLDYNFLHTGTGLSVKANIPNICFQFSSDLSSNTSASV